MKHLLVRLLCGSILLILSVPSHGQSGLWNLFHGAGKYGYLKIQTQPSSLNARVYVDNKYMGETKDLTAGLVLLAGKPYKIEIRAEDFPTYKETITVKSNEMKFIKYTPMKTQ